VEKEAAASSKKKKPKSKKKDKQLADQWEFEYFHFVIFM
jgi:hypothetical protein